jgi:exosome complex component MTR3
MEQPDECFDPLQFAADLDLSEIKSLPTDEKVYISKGLINQANGSAYIELSSTKVTCAIYGPRETSSSSDESYSKCLLETSIKFSPFSRQKRIDPLLVQYDNDEDCEEAELCSRLEEALLPCILLHKYPKSQIDIIIDIIEDDGQHLLSAIILSATVALIDACIELYDTVVAKSLKVTLCYMPNLAQVSCLFFDGEATPNELDLLTDEAVKQCQLLHKAICKVVISDLKSAVALNRKTI